MKLLKIFKKQKPKRQIGDFYQASIEKVGRAQLVKLADKGLSIPVATILKY